MTILDYISFLLLTSVVAYIAIRLYMLSSRVKKLEENKKGKKNKVIKG